MSQKTASHFDDYELESLLSAREKTRELDSLLEGLPPSGSVAFTRQQKPLGLGHAIWCARHLIGDEPFAVLLPDDLLVGKRGALAQMMDAYEQYGGVVVAAEERPVAELHRYGVFKTGRSQGAATEVLGVVEKPKPEDAPSRLCVIGRYILQPQVLAELGPARAGTGGEIQLTDSMARLIGRMPFHAIATGCERFDCGDKVGFLQANLIIGLHRTDTAPQLRALLEKALRDTAEPCPLAKAKPQLVHY